MADRICLFMVRYLRSSGCPTPSFPGRDGKLTALEQEYTSSRRSSPQRLKAAHASTGDFSGDPELAGAFHTPNKANDGTGARPP